MKSMKRIRKLYFGESKLVKNSMNDNNAGNERFLIPNLKSVSISNRASESTEIVVACGGIGDNYFHHCQDTVEYLSENNKSEWKTLPKMNEKRKLFDIVAIDEEIFAVGGYMYESSVESLKIGENQWKIRKPMNKGRQYHAVAAGNIRNKK